MNSLRKPRVELTVEQVIQFVSDEGIVNVLQVAERFDVHPSTARRKLEAAVYRGELVEDKYDEHGIRLDHLHYRYGYVS